MGIFNRDLDDTAVPTSLGESYILKITDALGGGGFISRQISCISLAGKAS